MKILVCYVATNEKIRIQGEVYKRIGIKNQFLRLSDGCIYQFEYDVEGERVDDGDHDVKRDN